MLDDILTVMWKERKGLFRYRGSRTRFLLTLAAPILMAIHGPLSDGPLWVQQEGPVVMATIISVIVILITVPDSFAGERERHTLETLLASRLPDRAILFGKLAVSVAFSWGLTQIVLLTGLVIVNVVHWDGKLVLFTPTIALASLGMSFLLSTLCASAGILVSLRSATAQEAAQTLAAIFFTPPMLLTVVLLALHGQIRELLGGLSGEQVLLVVVSVLALLDLLVFAAAMSRFQRSRLILD